MLSCTTFVRAKVNMLLHYVVEQNAGQNCQQCMKGYENYYCICITSCLYQSRQRVIFAYAEMRSYFLLGIMLFHQHQAVCYVVVKLHYVVQMLLQTSRAFSVMLLNLHVVSTDWRKKTLDEVSVNGYYIHCSLDTVLCILCECLLHSRNSDR
jgi:hypothetical protein